MKRRKAMEFKDVLYARHSVREFCPDAVPEDTLREIVREAGRTPSWENSQPWKVYIAYGESLKTIRRIFSDRADSKVKGNPDMPTQHRIDFSRQSQENMAEFNRKLIDCTKDPELTDFRKGQGELFKASAVVYLTLPKNASQWSVYDLGAFGQMLLLAAKDHGVDSIPAYAYVMYPDVLRKELSIPDNEMISMGIGLGYPTNHPMNSFRSGRLEPENYLILRC
jgi:nitroreductase